MWRDERFGLMEEMTRELRRSSLQRLNVSGWAAVNNAFSTSFAGFEASKSLCSTSHVGLDGVTRANRPSVDIGLSVTAIQGATTRFMNMTNERNLPLMLSPDVLVLNPAQRFTAREILGSSGAPYKADNEINSSCKRISATSSRATKPPRPRGSCWRKRPARPQLLLPRPSDV